MKAQVSMEFLMFVAIGFFIAIVIISVVWKAQSEKSREMEQRDIIDLAAMVENEITIAQAVEHGYWRNFSIDDRLPNGEDFSISSNNSYIRITGASSTLEFQVPPFQGTITKGSNIICNRNGGVFIGAICG